MSVSDTLFDAVSELDEYLKDDYAGEPLRGAILKVRDDMERLRDYLDRESFAAAGIPLTGKSSFRPNPDADVIPL